MAVTAAIDGLTMPALVSLALGVAIAATVLSERVIRPLSFAAAAGVLLLSVWLCVEVWTEGPQRYAVGGWGVPPGIALYADGSSAVFIAVTAVVFVCASVYASAYPTERLSPRRFWPLWWLLWAALNALYLSADLFNAYVALEMIGLSAAGLVALERSTTALSAALRYLLFTLFGSLAYLLGVGIAYGMHATLSMGQLARLLEADAATMVMLGLMTIGLLIKAALFPLHFWLPPAHGSAAPPVSAVLSGLVSKAALYLVVRLWFDMFEDVLPVLPAHLLGALGVAAIVWGSIAAMRQRRLKLLVAYSTVAQMGYLFLLFPLAGGAATQVAAQAWSGGLYYGVSHALAKAAMFLAAGAIVHAWGEDDIEHLEGTSARLPISVFAFGLAGVAIMGLPPSGGFIGKWLLLTSAMATGQWWWALALLAGGLFTAAYVFRVLRSAFVAPDPLRPLYPVPALMQYSALALALVALGMGLAAALPLSLLAIGAGDYRP